MAPSRPDTSRITRHFATIADGRFGPRQVHYRRVGAGPVVLCLHQSPLSSRDMLATMERWKNHFTCIAPDTPGFGLSDPLGVDRAETADYADAVVEFMDAIGVERAAVYGFHTGAMITGAVAQHHPDRVACAVANGYVILTEQARADIVANYLPAFAPSWDGSHLAWLWSRMREQVIFFPWYSKSSADRLRYTLPSPEQIHTGLLDFLRSGDNYRVGYRAAFTMRSDVALQRVRVPTLVTAQDTDVLARDLRRIRRPSASVTSKPGGDAARTLDLCRDFILQHAPPAAPPAPAAAALPCRLWQDWVDVAGGQLRIRRSTDATAGRTVLVLHDAIGSTEAVHEIARGFIGRRPVIALDLPGQGESDDTLGARTTVAGQARAVAQALRKLGLEELDVIGVGGGGLVGAELARQQPRAVRHLVIAGAHWFEPALRRRLREHGAPQIRPNWYGGHLLEAWHLVRDQALFFPWCERGPAGIVERTPSLDPADVHARAFDLLRSGERWRDATLAQLDYVLQKRVAGLRVPLRFAAAVWDPLFALTQRAAKESRRGPFVRLPDAAFDWAEALQPFLDA